jgi:spermidine synthase
MHWGYNIMCLPALAMLICAINSILKESFPRMSTTTPDTGEMKADEKTSAVTPGHTLQGWLLVILVFVAGIATLAIEMSASRLLAPYFGTSLFVWANLIGLILLYLTIGYYIGGRIADRYPSPAVLYGIVAIASLLVAAIPLAARPILSWSLSAFATYSVGVFYGSLVSVILLFAIPMILLGCVSPFAIRLRVERVGQAGRIAGMLYALSTAGSITGTFLSVLVFIPKLGTRYTIFIFAASLLLVSLIGLLTTWKGNLQLPKGLSLSNKRILFLLLVTTLVLILSGLQGPIKPASGIGRGTLLEEKESPYNYIQVVRSGTETQLVLNEGLGIHSIYNPNQLLTQGPWDYFMVAPYFNHPPFTAEQVRRACIIGLGAGTAPRQLSAAYGPIPIDGVEIDGEIVSMGRKYFQMKEPNLNVVVQDGRYFMQTTSQKYDIVGIDAYQQPYIPFQLTSTEFFREVQSHLTPTGVTIINIGRTSRDFRLVDAMAQNMKTVFSNVYIIDTERFTNSLVIATNAPTSLENFRINAGKLTNPLLQSVAQASLDYGNMREEKHAEVHFTDDRAPIEQLIDLIIFSEVEHGQQ